MAGKPTQRRRKPERVWDGRGDALEDARLTTAAGRLADDLRLKETHFRIMAHVGRQNGARGWLRVSQSELAERWAVHRNTINRAFGQLVEWEYLKQRTQEQAGESFCLYKVALDDEAELPPEAHTRAPGAGGECNPTSAPHAGGECSARSAPVQRQECTRAHGGSAPPTIYPRAHRLSPDSAEGFPLSPPPRLELPEAGGSGKPVDGQGGSGANPMAYRFTRRWAMEARAAVVALASATETAALGRFFAVLAGTLHPPAEVDAVAYVAAVADKLAGLGGAVLVPLADKVLAERKRDMPPVADLQAWLAPIAAAHAQRLHDVRTGEHKARIQRETLAKLAPGREAGAAPPLVDAIALRRAFVAATHDGAAKDAAWLDGVLVADRVGRRLKLVAPTKFAADWISGPNLCHEVAAAARRLWPQIESVECAAAQARAA